MKAAFSRLLLIALFVLLGLFLCVFMLRTIAHQQPPPPLKSSLLQRRPLILAKNGGEGEAPAQSIPAFEASLRGYDQTLLEIVLRRTLDGQWVAFAPQWVEEQTEGRGPLSSLTLEQVKKLNLGYRFKDAQGQSSFRAQDLKVQTAAEVFKRFPTASFLVQIHEKDVTAIDSFLAQLQAWKLKDRSILCSPMARTLMVLKRKMPEGVFCFSTTELARAAFMSGLYLESLVAMEADLFLAGPPQSSHHWPYSSRLLAELKRRGKVIVVTLDDPQAYRGNLMEKFVDGLLTTRPTFTLQRMQSEK